MRALGIDGNKDGTGDRVRIAADDYHEAALQPPRVNLLLKYILQLQTNYKKLVKIQIYSRFFVHHRSSS